MRASGSVSKTCAVVSLGLLVSIAVQAGFTGHQAQELVSLFFNGVRLLLGQ